MGGKEKKMERRGERKKSERKKEIIEYIKQKTAYEIKYGLVGSEMCIRDRTTPRPRRSSPTARAP